MNCEGFGRGLFCVLSGHLPVRSKGKNDGIYGLRYYRRDSKRVPPGMFHRHCSDVLLYSHFWHDSVITFIIYHAVCRECDQNTVRSAFVAFFLFFDVCAVIRVQGQAYNFCQICFEHVTSLVHSVVPHNCYDLFSLY